MAKYRCIDRDRCQLAKDGVILNIPDGVQTVAQCPLKNENPECFHHLFPVGDGNRLDLLRILLWILVIAVLSFGGYGIYHYQSTSTVPSDKTETPDESTALNTELEKQNTEIDDLNKKINTQTELAPQLQSLQTQLEEKNASITVLNAELEKQKTEINDLNKKIKEQDYLVKQKEFLSNFNVDFEYLDEDSQSNILVDDTSLNSASSYRVIVKNKQKAYISILQKDHSKNECHLLNRDNLVIELEPGTHYVPADGIRYFSLPSDTSNGKQTLFVQAARDAESLSILKECPTQHNCDTCIAVVDFYFKK